MKFTAPIRRKDTAKGHHYVDAEGRRVPGVTSIIGDGVPKPALINWAANTTADWAVNHWDELGEKPPAARLDVLRKARYVDKDTAANRGTQVHAIAEKLIAGEEVAVPEELAGHAESYARFLDEFQVEPVHVEFTVISYRWSYAGTGDLIASLLMPGGSRRTLLMDVKTNRSGIYGETALQLAGYRYADNIVPNDGIAKGIETPMPEVEGCAAIHVRGDGYSLIPVTAEQQQHKQLLYAQQVAQFTKDSRDLVGAAVEPPTTSTFRLTRSTDRSES